MTKLMSKKDSGSVYWKAQIYMFLLSLLECKILEPRNGFSKMKASYSVMVHAYNSSPPKAEEGGFWVPGQARQAIYGDYL